MATAVRRMAGSEDLVGLCNSCATGSPARSTDTAVFVSFLLQAYTSAFGTEMISDYDDDDGDCDDCAVFTVVTVIRTTVASRVCSFPGPWNPDLSALHRIEASRNYIDGFGNI